MPTLTIIEFNGTEHQLEAEVGKSAMQAAVDGLVPGILADCGGSCSCATCHCYVDEAWAEKVGQPSAHECDMLEAASAELRPTSRLSCQITVTDALDGIVVYLPETQF